MCSNESVLALKDPNRPFPTGAPLGVLKWRLQVRLTVGLVIGWDVMKSEGGWACSSGGCRCEPWQRFAVHRHYAEWRPH